MATFMIPPISRHRRCATQAMPTWSRLPRQPMPSSSPVTMTCSTRASPRRQSPLGICFSGSHGHDWVAARPPAMHSVRRTDSAQSSSSSSSPANSASSCAVWASMTELKARQAFSTALFASRIKRLHLLDVRLVPVLPNVAPVQRLLDPDPAERVVQRHVGRFEIVGDGGPLVVINEYLALPQRRPLLDDLNPGAVLIVRFVERRVWHRPTLSLVGSPDQTPSA